MTSSRPARFQDSHRPHLKMPSPWVETLQHMNGVGAQIFSLKYTGRWILVNFIYLLKESHKEKGPSSAPVTIPPHTALSTSPPPL